MQPPVLPAEAAEESPLHLDPPTPRKPAGGQIPVTPASTPPPRRRGGRGAGIALVSILILLILLGSGIGFMIYRMAGITP
jgi:hypothetical protein